MKDDEGFIPPTPRTIDRMVLGVMIQHGQVHKILFHFYQTPHKTIRLILPDEGDIPKFEITDKT